MDIFYTSTFLIFEWFKTFLLFSLIDKILIKRNIREILKNHDTYISSLVVAAFLIILRSYDLSFSLFLVWAVAVVVIYTLIHILFRIFIGG